MKTYNEIKFEVFINKLYKAFAEKFKKELICPNCYRKVPNKDHFIKNGCKWCVNQN